jgi:hypothetical protein
MVRNFFFRRYRERAGDEGAGGGEQRPSPAEINARANRARLERINAIGEVADGRRAADMSDVDGERVTGRFADGELDESEGARLRQAEIDADATEEARLRQAERDREAEDLESRSDEARRLQEEGGESRGQGDDSTGQGDSGEEADEKIVDGVRYYRTIVAGAEKWLTLKELRAGVSNGLTTEETLRRAQEALASASQSPPTPKADPDEGLSESDLENVILSASMGDEEAVKKLASELRRRPKGTDPKDVSRLVAQQIATQREVDRAEQAQADFLGNDTLAPIFRMRLTAFAQEKPNTKIGDAYKSVGEQMRRDFAPMLSRATPNGGANPGSTKHLSKQDRKRTIVSPPQSAGRQPRREDEDREVPLGEQIDAIARSRGQQRAYRVRRS